MSTSPYAPPRAAVVDEPVHAGNQAEAIRREHIRHEIQLKSVGLLYYLGGALMVIAAIGLILALVLPSTNRPSSAPPGLFVGVLALYLAFGTGALFLGYGFRRLKPWVRIPGGIMAGIGLLGIPVGTLINGWILYLMFCKKGQVVLGEDYQNVIAATPHVKYQRSVGDWIAISLLGLLLLAVVVALVAARMR